MEYPRLITLVLLIALQTVHSSKEIKKFATQTHKKLLSDFATEKKYNKELIPLTKNQTVLNIKIKLWLESIFSFIKHAQIYPIFV